MIYHKNKILVVVLLFVTFGQVSKSFAQNENKFSQNSEVRQVYFGEGLPIEIFNNMEMNNLSIGIKNEQSKSIATKTSESLEDFTFSVPGTYTIELASEHIADSGHEECNHSDHNRTVLIEVLPYSIQFDFDKMKLSSEIVGGKEMANETLTIPVIVKTYSGGGLKTQELKVSAAGVNTTLEGNSKEENLTLNEGVNLVTYQLNGSASKNTYIMFDFYDMNGRVHSFGYTTQIK
jgi:hypothetical protein